MNLLTFLLTRHDEASIVIKHLTILDVASLQPVCRGLRSWSRRATREMLGNNGIVACGTHGLTLDLLSMRLSGPTTPDQGILFFTGLHTTNTVGKTCRVLLRCNNSRYSLRWDVFDNATPRSQRLLAHTHGAHVLRPLMLPATVGLCDGLLIVSPCGSGDKHDFIPHAHMAEFIDTGNGNEEKHMQLFDQLYETNKHPAWARHVTSGCLYESAAHVPELGGVLYTNWDTMCFNGYCPKNGFIGKPVALPLAHSLRRCLIPRASTLAYDAFSGTLYMVGGKLNNGRKSGVVYAFALREYLRCFANAPDANTQVTDAGVFPVRTASKSIHPGHKFLFQPVCYLQHERSWCAVRFAHQGKVMIVWGGQGKGNKSPSAIEIFYKHRPLNLPVASPDNVVW